MIRRETDYAIRTVLCLAQENFEQGASVSTLELAERTGVPYRFLRKIMSKLAAGGIVQSRRGKGGGIQLARQPDDITLLDLLDLMDPDAVRMNQCMGATPLDCNRAAYCGVRRALAVGQQNQRDALAAITMGQVDGLETRPPSPA